jgi:hypothetical protein
MPTLRMDGSDPFERYAYDPAKEKDIMKRKTSLNAMATLWLLLFSVSFSAVSVAAAPTKPDKESILRAYGKIPLYFIENKGQLDPKVKFYVKTSGQTLYFTDEGVVFDFHRNKKKDARNGAKGGLKGHQNRGVKTERLVFNLGFENAREGIMIKGLDRQDAVINCFLGNDRSKWKSDIPTYSGVVYKGIYKRIDLKVFGNGKGIEYEFIVNPGGNPGDILLTYNGIEGLATSREGEMLIATAFGELKETRPYIYQEIKGKRAVDGRFAIQSPAGQSQTGKFSYGFQVASYNPSYPLIIDPTLSYSTYLGGSDSEEGYGIAVDGSGNAYVAGNTRSTDFPTQNPYQGTHAGDYDVFITKLSPTGNALSYSTYLGGSGFDFARGIAVDGSGNAYVTGETRSTDFPTQNPYQGTYAGGYFDVFITKLSPNGNTLSYSTYLGGSDSEGGYGIAVDDAGNAYVTGNTRSTDFPTQNPYQGTNSSWSGYGDAFITKLSPTGNALSYSTYLGGSDSEGGNGIAVDDAGNAYVTGTTSSTDFPTQNPYQGTLGGWWDAFITKLSPTGNALSYSTYLGGSGYEEGYGIAVDGSGNAYVAGETSSTNFPTQNPYQGANAGDWDAFITKLSPTGNALSYSTYLGGSGFDRGNGIAVNGSGNAYITGRTYSINFPSRNPYQGAHAGGERDAFITKLSPTGNALSYSTYFGGSGDDFARGIAVDGSGNAYVTGATSSTNFPIQNAYQGTYAGGERDAFVAKLSDTMLTLAGPLSDTGQTKCYNRDSESGIPCPKPGEAFYGQDGNYLINSPSYTKLDAAGNDLLNTATKWTMVRDNLTRLIWEVKTDDGSIHDRDNQYEWQNAQDIFVAQVNIANFGGHSDWRLPTIQELSSITALGQDDPAVSETYFPNTVSSDYWSSTAGTTGGGDYDSDFAWIVYFKHGHGYNHPKYNYYYVRAVRGGQSGSLDHLVINSDGTVTDTNTGLMWQQSTTGIVNWQSALAECEGLTLGGYGDWRLPNRRELNSIVDYTLYNPAVSETYFPNTVAFYYWSSTTYTYYIYGAWQVHFKFGEDSWSYKSDGGYVRAVRGGQNWLLGSLTISTPSQGSMWKGGDIMPIRWNTSGISGNVKISISSQGGKDGTFHTIIDSTPNDGSYHWTVNVATSVNCMLRVEPVSDATKGTSQGLFSIETSGAPFVPKLQLAISGLQLSISWTNVVNANGYIFSYAPAPYNGLDTIRTIDMADKTSFSVELWDGAAFFVAVQAYNDAGISTYSNIEYVEIDLTNISVIPSNLNLSQGGTKTFDISGGTRPYSAPSMDTEVARFGTSGSILYVKGISTGSTTPSNGR